jgi:hypothetical protein
MKRMLSRLALLLALLALSSVPLFAQDIGGEVGTGTTDTDAPFFSDNRINNRIILGEFGLYCTDANGQISNTFQNGGGLAVWGANGQQYIFVPEGQISFFGDDANANQTMPQFNGMNNTFASSARSVAGAQGTSAESESSDQTMGSANAAQSTLGSFGNLSNQSAQSSSSTNSMTRSQSNQRAVAGQFPVLLGQATAMNGLVQLYLTAPGAFQLNGFLPDGKGFTYNWSGCSGGTGINTF